jgi:dTDP-glucose pyrophosphorylase
VTDSLRPGRAATRRTRRTLPRPRPSGRRADERRGPRREPEFREHRVDPEKDGRRQRERHVEPEPPARRGDRTRARLGGDDEAAADQEDGPTDEERDGDGDGREQRLQRLGPARTEPGDTDEVTDPREQRPENPGRRERGERGRRHGVPRVGGDRRDRNQHEEVDDEHHRDDLGDAVGPGPAPDGQALDGERERGDERQSSPDDALRHRSVLAGDRGAGRLDISLRPRELPSRPGERRADGVPRDDGDGRERWVAKRPSQVDCQRPRQVIVRANGRRRETSQPDDSYFRSFRDRGRMDIDAAVVLAAGEGTRLRPLTRNRPKPMLPAADRPILDHVLEALVEAGVTDLHLVVGYGRDRVQNHVGPTFQNRPVTYHVQDKQLGSGHALLQARGALETDFVVINGDQIAASPMITRVAEAHTRSDTVTMAVRESARASAYGAVELDGDRVAALVERPREGTYRLMNAGIYAFGPSIFADLDAAERRAGELAITDAIAGQTGDESAVRGVRTEGLWIDATYPWDLPRVARELLARGLVGPPARG